MTKNSNQGGGGSCLKNGLAWLRNYASFELETRAYCTDKQPKEKQALASTTSTAGFCDLHMKSAGFDFVSRPRLLFEGLRPRGDIES